MRAMLATAVFALTLSGQVDVTVSRQLIPGATEALFTVDATAPASAGLPQVAALLEAEACGPSISSGPRFSGACRTYFWAKGGRLQSTIRLNYASPPGGWKACRRKWTAFLLQLGHQIRAPKLRCHLGRRETFLGTGVAAGSRFQ